MKKFIVDFEGEEEYADDVTTRALDGTAQFPSVLYMIGFGSTDTLLEGVRYIRQYTEIPLFLVKFKRMGGTNTFAIGITRSFIEEHADVVDALNRASRDHINFLYFFTLYVASVNDMPDYPDGLGHHHAIHLHNAFEFIEIYAVVDPDGNINPLERHLTPGG